MITLYCGESIEHWNSDSLATGIGGSEQAVIYLTRALRTRMQVFNDTEKPKTDGDVTYIPFREIEKVEETDDLIIWRRPQAILQLKHVRAKRRILWLHDLIPEIEILPFIHMYDSIVVASHFHKERYPNLPEGLVRIIPLGIDIPSIALDDGITRNPWKICYFSAYDRGLRVLLEDWTQLKLLFPQLELVIGYGWTTMEGLSKDQRELKFARQYLESMFTQEGITHLDRVGQPEVLRHMHESQLLVYPSIWPETFCLVAAQAQACGAVPVTTPLAALDETVRFGYKCMNEPVWMEKMIEALSHPEDVEFIRAEMMNEIRAMYSWDTVAEAWSKSILTV